MSEARVHGWSHRWTRHTPNAELARDILRAHFPTLFLSFTVQASQAYACAVPRAVVNNPRRSHTTRVPAPLRGACNCTALFGVPPPLETLETWRAALVVLAVAFLFVGGLAFTAAGCRCARACSRTPHNYFRRGIRDRMIEIDLPRPCAPFKRIREVGGNSIFATCKAVVSPLARLALGAWVSEVELVAMSARRTMLALLRGVILRAVAFAGHILADLRRLAGVEVFVKLAAALPRRAVREGLPRAAGHSTQ